jgi:6-phosphogluconolactonase
MEQARDVRCYTSAAAVNAALGKYVADAADAAIAARGRFVLATSGGSLPKSLGEALQAAVDGGRELATDKWHVFYVDERVVPLDHADSNHAATAAAVYNKVRPAAP